MKIMRGSLFSVAVATGFAVASVAWADEGMWTFDNFPAAKVRAAYGWAPDQAWLDHVRLASARLSVGCSSSFVSPEGLVMTNHHCVSDCLSALSDASHNDIENGFYAPALADEKSCPGMEANQLTSITDVTKTIQAATQGLSDAKFAAAERAAIAKQEKLCTTGDDVHCEVVTLYHGGIYDLYKYQLYQDLRLVWAPEDREANFGGDPDNFNYPRYAIDAAFLRAYAHGKPVATPQYLRFAPNAAKPGDLVFTSGNPGDTYREFTVAQLEYRRDVSVPLWIELDAEQRGMLQEFGTEGAFQKRISLDDLNEDENDLKENKGDEQSLITGGLLDAKRAEEAALRRQVAANPQLQATRGAWDAIAVAVAHQKTLAARYLLLEELPQYLGTDRVWQAIELNRYAAETQKPDGQRLEEYTASQLPALKDDITSTAPEYALLDKKLIAWWLTKIREYLGADDADVHAILGKSSPDEIAAAVVDDSKLGDPAARAKLLAAGPAAINASQDPLLLLVRRLDGPARAVRADDENNVQAPITKNADLIAHAKFVLYGTSVYPDATFTPRLSYGTVKGYQQDGKTIAPFTDFAGAYARATGSDPFKLPDSWIKAESQINLATKLDMVTDNDIVGGNSGSPLVDRNGDLTGLVFDGDIQSIGGNYWFDDSVNRTVAVDVTALREGLAKIYHADRLVKELGQ